MNKSWYVNDISHIFWDPGIIKCHLHILILANSSETTFLFCYFLTAERGYTSYLVLFLVTQEVHKGTCWQLIISLLSADCQQIVSRLSADCQPIVCNHQLIVSRLSANCQLIVILRANGMRLLLFFFGRTAFDLFHFSFKFIPPLIRFYFYSIVTNHNFCSFYQEFYPSEFKISQNFIT